MTSFSFEVFPPKTEVGLARFGDVAAELMALRPDYISVTYGAGGSDQHRSFEAISRVVESGADVAGHLTCVGQTKADIDEVIARYRRLGVDHVVALRGDPPTGIDAPYEPHPNGYATTADLVTMAKAMGVGTVSVSGYPEVHPQSPSADHDLGILAGKVDAGADRAITQMCFDTDLIVRYVERVHARGIDVDVVPGIFPIHSLPAVTRFAGRCGADIPSAVAERFAGLDDDAETSEKLGAEFAVEQIAQLADHGIDRVHIYTINRPSLARAVVEQLAVPAS
jgi:methylenetetrahydrofolate reductase (NADPH)